MKTRHQAINPAALGAPKGYSNGILAAEGRLLFVAGQVGWNAEEVFESDVFADQFDKALGNILSVVADSSSFIESSILRFTRNNPHLFRR